MGRFVYGRGARSCSRAHLGQPHPTIPGIKEDYLADSYIFPVLVETNVFESLEAFELRSLRWHIRFHSQVGKVRTSVGSFEADKSREAGHFDCCVNGGERNVFENRTASVI